jgi:AraC-like DNA-binding protein
LIQYHALAPLNELADVLECVWHTWDDEVEENRSIERIIPDGCPELIIHLNDPFQRQIEGEWHTQSKLFIAGTLTKPWMIRPGKRISTVGLRFKPSMLWQVFELNMMNTLNIETELHELVSKTVYDNLIKELSTCSSGDAAMQITQTCLIGLLKPVSRSNFAQKAVNLIQESKGRISSDQLSIALSRSSRTIELAFIADMGITPKHYARIVRMLHVLQLVEQSEGEKIVDAALAAGYYDEAHMHRDFRLLVGRSPRQTRDHDGALAKHFTDPQRIADILADA